MSPNVPLFSSPTNFSSDQLESPNDSVQVDIYDLLGSQSLICTTIWNGHYTAVARVKVLDAHRDPHIPAAADLRHIILAGGLFAVLASNEGSVEYMPP